MKKIILVLVAITALSSCSEKKQFEDLYIYTTINKSVKGEGSITKPKSIYKNEYINIKFSSMPENDFVAGYYLTENFEDKENYHFESIHISDKEGNELRFKNANEFLNFMSAKGYDLIEHTPNKYGGDYTFKTIRK